jgi:hypothetical protein
VPARAGIYAALALCLMVFGGADEIAFIYFQF